jgi:hypothetical protein
MTKRGNVEKRLPPCAAEKYGITSWVYPWVHWCMETSAAQTASTHQYENESGMLKLLGWSGFSCGRFLQQLPQTGTRSTQ